MLPRQRGPGANKGLAAATPLGALRPGAIDQAASLFMEGSFDGMLLLDDSGHVVHANSAVGRLLGQPASLLVGRRIGDLVAAPTDLRKVRDAGIEEAILECGGEFHTARRADGSIATVMVRKSAHASGRQLWVLRDVTRQRPVLEALERKTRLLMEAERVGQMGAWELDTATGLLLLTEELQRIMGLVDTPVISIEEGFSFYTEASRAILREAFNATMLHGTPYDLELEMKTRQGNLIWVREVCRATSGGAPMNSLTGITQDITERRRMTDLLARSADLERARIGADLHDGLGQQLTGLALLLRSTATRARQEIPPRYEELDELSRIASESIQTVRDMAHAMLPLELRQLGFIRVCQHLANSTQKSSGIIVKFRFLGDRSHVPTGPTAEHLYRIAQETIANAVKHAAPTRISLTLKAGDTKLVLTVSNNGMGIDLTLATEGMGLQIMRYRARLLGGLVNVRRASHGGTVVRCVVPRAQN